MKHFKGHFITVEGGEGSGKSTLLNTLSEKLSQLGYTVVKTREPGGTQLGEQIRHLLLNHEVDVPISHQAELLLFLAARAQHIEEVIKPALEAGKIILCDRFNDSTIAYQGAARGLDMKEVYKLCRIVCGEIEPELTLFLDVDPEIGLARTHKLDKEQAGAGQFDRIENEALAFHKRVQEAFRLLARREPLRIYRINANQSQSDVLAEALRSVDEFILLPSKKGFA